MALLLASLVSAVGPDVLVVFAVVAFALVLFVFEPIAIDMAAILVLVVLVVLEPWTQITPELGISGFANPATITVLSMYVLSEGVQRTGAVRTLADQVITVAGDDERKQLAATIGLGGGTAGIINNTPVVAVLIPMVTDIADRTDTSASKLLLPLSYAAMLGGMLTLIGTSPNILASDISDRLIGRPFSMFEFTQLGVLVLLTGAVYLLTVGHRLIPDRTESDDPAEKFQLRRYLSEVWIPADSRFVGKPASAVFALFGGDVDVVRLLRRGKVIHRDLGSRTLRAGDRFLLRASRRRLFGLSAIPGLELAGEPVTEPTDEESVLTEVIVVPEAVMDRDSMTAFEFNRRFDTTTLGIQRRGELLTKRLSKIVLRGGDTLLVQTSTRALRELQENPNFVVTDEVAAPEYRRSKIPIAIAIIVGVIGVAALGIFPIVITALAGMVGMVLSGCVKPQEVYGAVDWNVIFLLAGVIPLGVALEETGGAELLAVQLTVFAEFVPLVVFVMGFYLLTTLLTNVITNLASAALMIPIAVDLAAELGTDPFSFVLVVTFAASTALMTPVGYQTNLMVYSRGGYEFSDFIRVGAPLQLLLAVVTSLGIAAFWGF